MRTKTQHFVMVVPRMDNPSFSSLIWTWSVNADVHVRHFIRFRKTKKVELRIEFSHNP